MTGGYLFRLLNRLFLLGILLTASGWGQLYRGAELRSHERFRYGRFETRFKAAQGEGFLASFFTYNDSFPHNDWCEIDFEVLGRWPDNVDLNVIDENGSHLRQNPVAFNPHMDFHVYAFEWTPEYVAWFIDDEEVYRQTGGHITHLSQSAKLMMNVWTPAYTDWVGFIDTRTLPRFAYYDWASFAAYTPGAGTVGSNFDFTPAWRDDFDTFDEDRWEKSDGHTWNGNNALLVEENIVHSDGYMILCLTEPGEEGYDDHTLPQILWARAIDEDSVVVKFNKELDPDHTRESSIFTIPNTTLENMHLYADLTTVGLRLDGLNLNQAATVYAQNLRDASVNANTQMVSFTPVIMPDPLDLPISIDCGGPGAQGFLPDQWWSEEVEYGHAGGNYQTHAGYPDISGSELDSVLATSLNRYSRYHVRLAPGIFDIRLHFTEHFYTGAGERVFELFVEDSLVEAGLDVYAQVGNSGVYILELNGWEITDGTLDILGAALTYGRSYAYAGPLLNAIQIDGSYYVASESFTAPVGYQIAAPFPNPFNQSTRLEFSLPESVHLEIDLVDLRGAVVQTTSSQLFQAGTHELLLHGEGLPSGVYIIRFRGAHFQTQRKILLLK